MKSPFQKNRVRIAQITFYAIFIYAFFFRHIEIPPFDSATCIAGLVLVALGVAVRTLAAGTIHKNKSLATNGLYAIVRHPLYTGSLLVAVGLAIVIRDPLFSTAMVALFLITYIPTIGGEEKKLARLFPDEWPAYAASTPRLIPKLTALGQLRGLQWDGAQWRRNREYQAALTVVAIVGLLYLYGRLSFG